MPPTNPRIEALLAFLASDPDDAFTLFALAQEYARAGDLHHALAHYRRLRTMHPAYVGTYYHLGKTLEKVGLRDDALAAYRDGIVVATEVGDLHARAELQDALAKCEMGWDDD